MEQCVDEQNKIIHVKCTEAEKRKLMSEISEHPLYDYEFNFLIIDETNKK
jgi:hypothetical protein